MALNIPNPLNLVPKSRRASAQTWRAWRAPYDVQKHVAHPCRPQGFTRVESMRQGEPAF